MELFNTFKGIVIIDDCIVLKESKKKIKTMKIDK